MAPLPFSTVGFSGEIMRQLTLAVKRANVPSLVPRQATPEAVWAAEGNRNSKQTKSAGIAQTGPIPRSIPLPAFIG